MPKALTDAQARCLHSFWDFWIEALEAPRHDKPHQEMAAFISDFSQDKKLCLVPRGTWKTSMLSTAFPLWMGLRAYFLEDNPSFRCLIDSETTRNSKLILNAIAAYMENGVAFRRIFGNFYKKELHTMDSLEFTFNEKRSGNVKEPNFLASGLKSAKTGLHFDLINLDDLVSKDNYHSLAMREKVWEHYRMMYSIKIADAGAKTFFNVIGTRYHDDDLYGRILHEEEERVAEEKAPIFSTMIRSCIEDDGSLFFPDVLTQEVLEELQDTQKGLFWANYHNDPNKHNAPFKKEQLKWHSLVNFPALRMRRMTIDPAIKEDQIEHGDFNAIVVNGWDQFGQPWILDVSLKRDLDPAAFFELFFTMASRWQPEQILIELTSGSMLAELLQAQMQQRKMFFPVFFIKANKLQGKMTRWMKMRSYADRGIRIATEIPATTKAELEYQWERAPFARNDDFMDAFELQFTYLAQTAGEAQPLTDTQQVIAAANTIEAGFVSLEMLFPHIKALRHSQEQAEAELVALSPDNESELLLAGGVQWQ